jgi:hypothetical protein
VHAFRPHGEVAARAFDVLRNLVDPRDDAEVDQREPFRLVTQDVVERTLPGFEIDVRGRRLGEDMLSGQDANTGRVAGEQRAVFEQLTNVMRRVAGSTK